MIMLAFAASIQSGHDGRMTLADIARAVNRAPSTKLRDMVTELISENLITYTVEPMPGVVGKRFIYAPTSDFDSNTGKPKPVHRTIKFKARKNGQTVLWDEVLT
jgi:hypothetical protein